MRKKIRKQCIYLVLLTILGFSFVSCSVYNKYQTASSVNDGRSLKSFGESHNSDNNQNVGDSLLRDESDVIQSKEDDSGISEDIIVTVDAVNNSEPEKPLLEHYEELNTQLLEDEKEINQLKEKRDALDIIVKELEAGVENFKAKLEEEKRKRLDLERKNNELLIKYTNERSDLKECEKRYAEEIEKLKIQLVESQIAEVKVKQELVRIKTQYIMDKKKWTQ